MTANTETGAAGERGGGAARAPQAPHASHLPHAQLSRAADVMHDVREKCVWTQEITHEALIPYLIEESHELIDAIESGSRADLREELGDVLWQVLFHAEIASRDAAAPFDIDDVAGDLADKMVRRHPHVFAGEIATTPAEVLVHWNAAKAAEKRTRTSVLDGVSMGMPALALADKLLGKAARVSVPVAVAVPVLPAQPAQPVQPALPAPDREAGVPDAAAEASIGDRLLGLVIEARAAGLDAEGLLRARLRGLENDIRAAEHRAERGVEQGVEQASGSATAADLAE